MREVSARVRVRARGPVVLGRSVLGPVIRGLAVRHLVFLLAFRSAPLVSAPAPARAAAYRRATCVRVEARLGPARGDGYTATVVWLV